MLYVVYGLMRFAEKLEFLIGLRGTNQSQLSRQTGIAQSAISEMTKGKRRAYMNQALLLARALEVSLDYLADDAQERPHPVELTEAEEQLLAIARAFGPDRVLMRLVEVGMDECRPPHFAPGQGQDKRRNIQGHADP